MSDGYIIDLPNDEDLVGNPPENPHGLGKTDPNSPKGLSQQLQGERDAEERARIDAKKAQRALEEFFESIFYNHWSVKAEPRICWGERPGGWNHIIKVEDGSPPSEEKGFFIEKLHPDIVNHLVLCHEYFVSERDRISPTARLGSEKGPSQILTVRFSSNEARLLKEIARRKGMPVAELIRDAVKDKVLYGVKMSDE